MSDFCTTDSINNDAEQCEKKLGKPPSIDEDESRLTISESIAKRIESGGIINEERLIDYDNYWIEKLNCIDNSHTTRNKLNMAEVESIMKRLTDYTRSKSPVTCPVDKTEIVQCYTLFKGQTLKCDEEAKHFIDCVDNLLYEAVRENNEFSKIAQKKFTYTEQFNQGLI